MAGGTGSGSGAADPALFVDRLVVLTPAAAERDAVDRVTALWQAVGARTLAMSAADHDRAVARSSHLPQLIAYALAATLDADAEKVRVLDLAGPGLGDMTRLAASDPEMWLPIVDANREHLLAAIDELAAQWAELRATVDRGDRAALRALIARARALRHELEER
jgi:prephenate dehydrogenase